MPQPTDIPSFASTQLTLLSAELEAELSETNELLTSHTPSALARAGLAILNLNITSIRTGLGGKTVLELGLDSAVVNKGAAPDIPEHGIRVGDIVAVQEQVGASAKKGEKREAAKRGVEGVVLRVRRENVEVVLDKEEEDGVNGGGRLWMWVFTAVLRRSFWTRLMRLMCVLESSWRTMSHTSGTFLLFLPWVLTWMLMMGLG